MTRAEFRAVIEPALLALGAQWDAMTWAAYYRALADVPLRFLVAAMAQIARQPRAPYAPAFPAAPTILAYAEAAGLAIFAANPYTGCVDCEDSPGFRPRRDLLRTVERCPCRVRYLARLAAVDPPSAAI